MKGQWIFDLVYRVFEKELYPIEAVNFAKFRFQKKPATFTLNGIQFKNADHIIWSIAWEIFIAKRYSPKGFEIFENDCIVDIGAHQGLFTAFAAKRTKGQIISIEPDPENFCVLHDLVVYNKWNNVTLLNGAVSPKPGIAKLFKSNASSRNATTGVDPISAHPLTNFIEVKAYTLLEIIQNIPNVDLLKIDCEGAEYSILMNAGDLLKRIKRISMEVHPRTPGADLNGLVTFLRSYYKSVTLQMHPGDNLGFLYAK